MVFDTVDVQEGDKIIFDSQEYEVQGVSRQRRGFSIPDFKQITMIKPQEE